jgi:hypothetical protein
MWRILAGNGGPEPVAYPLVGWPAQQLETVDEATWSDDGLRAPGQLKFIMPAGKLNC